jgi:hypothetical protein
MTASCTAWAPWSAGRCSRMVNREVRSTRVPIAERLLAPVMSRVAPAHCCAGAP